MVTHESARKTREVYGEGLRSVQKKILVGPRDGYPGFLREFTLEPGGHTPYHRHDWGHVVYVLEGQGTVRIADAEHPLRAGSVVSTGLGEMHGFINTGPGQLRFLCLVSEKGDAYAPED
jgi:quercetin dioxygenase-like cupin family protein